MVEFLNDHDIKFYSQLARNRIFESKQLRYQRSGGYWTKVGLIKGKIQVQIVRNRKKYFVTNDLNVSRKEQLDTYKIRWKIEEIFRYVKQNLGFEKCEARDEKIQHNHFGSCFTLFAILQNISERTQIPPYSIKLKSIYSKDFVDSLNLIQYFSTA